MTPQALLPLWRVIVSAEEKRGVLFWPPVFVDYCGRVLATRDRPYLPLSIRIDPGPLRTEEDRPRWPHRPTRLHWRRVGGPIATRRDVQRSDVHFRSCSCRLYRESHRALSRQHSRYW